MGTLILEDINMSVLKSTPRGLLPVLDDREREWDSDSAIRRVRTFTNSKDNPSSTYKNAFLYFDPDDADNFRGYKLPIADVVDGKLVAIPRAIFSAAGAISGARGGVNIPDGDKSTITTKINRYYDIMSDLFDDDIESPLKYKPEYDDQEDKSFESKTFTCFAELKAYGDDDDEEDKGRFEGYASIFGNKDLGNDVVVEGAFRKSLMRRKPKNVKMLMQHDTKMPIGVYDKIKEDENGLKVQGRLALGTQKGKEAYELLKMGALDGLSIGYKADPKKQVYDERKRKRYLKEVDLMEISLVTFPMNPKAQITSVKANDRTIRDWEKFLREEGNLSRSQSKIASKAIYSSLVDHWDDAKQDNSGLISSFKDVIKILSTTNTKKE
tara:strand:+ start:521 stop:1666 length:1146 start_codon:yes stop_codon:yes gene_type:complete